MPYPSIGTVDQHSVLEGYLQNPQDKMINFIVKKENSLLYEEYKITKYMCNKMNIHTRTFEFEEIKETYGVMKNHFHNFYNDTIAKNKLIPVKSELVVGDKELMLCGMIDQIFWNEKQQCLQIWDWKTNISFYY